VCSLEAGRFAIFFFWSLLVFPSPPAFSVVEDSRLFCQVRTAWKSPSLLLVLGGQAVLPAPPLLFFTNPLPEVTEDLFSTPVGHQGVRVYGPSDLRDYG